MSSQEVVDFVHEQFKSVRRSTSIHYPNVILWLRPWQPGWGLKGSDARNLTLVSDDKKRPLVTNVICTFTEINYNRNRRTKTFWPIEIRDQKCVFHPST